MNEVDQSVEDAILPDEVDKLMVMRRAFNPALDLVTSAGASMVCIPCIFMLVDPVVAGITPLADPKVIVAGVALVALRPTAAMPASGPPRATVRHNLKEV